MSNIIETPDITCSICLESMNGCNEREWTWLLPDNSNCQGVYHLDCVRNFVDVAFSEERAPTCPLCRMKIESIQTGDSDQSLPLPSKTIALTRAIAQNHDVAQARQILNEVDPNAERTVFRHLCRCTLEEACKHPSTNIGRTLLENQTLRERLQRSDFRDVLKLKLKDAVTQRQLEIAKALYSIFS